MRAGQRWRSPGSPARVSRKRPDLLPGRAWAARCCSTRRRAAEPRSSAGARDRRLLPLVPGGRSSGLYRHWLLFPFTGFAYALVSDEYAPAATIGSISPTPLLVVHGTADRCRSPSVRTGHLRPRARAARALARARNGSPATWRSEAARDLLVAKLDELAPPDPENERGHDASAPQPRRTSKSARLR